MATHRFNNTITFNGISSEDIGVSVETFPDYNFPARVYESVHVPGLNGDIILDDDSYENVERTYRVSIYKEGATSVVPFHDISRRFSEWIHPSSGYKVLADTYDPDIYRMATVLDSGTVTNLFNMAGTCQLTFNCKPQKFLTAYNSFVSRANNSVVSPITPYAARPVIYVQSDYISSSKAEITIKLGQYEVVLQKPSIEWPDRIYVDSELQDCYSTDSSGNNLANFNVYSRLKNNIFPKLDPGVTSTIQLDGVSRIYLKENWWTL